MQTEEAAFHLGCCREEFPSKLTLIQISVTYLNISFTFVCGPVFKDKIIATMKSKHVDTEVCKLAGNRSQNL